jgi:hypothetical protein
VAQEAAAQQQEPYRQASASSPEESLHLRPSTGGKGGQVLKTKETSVATARIYSLGQASDMTQTVMAVLAAAVLAVLVLAVALRFPAMAV